MIKKLFVTSSISLFALTILCACAFAQQPKKRPSSKPTVEVTPTKSNPDSPKSETQDRQKPITNSDIIRMVKADFGDSIIVNHIKSNETQFDVSINALFELKNAGVSQKIIEAMQFSVTDKRTTPTVSEQVRTTPTQKPTPDNPLIRQSEMGDSSEMSMMGVILIDGSKRVEMKSSQSNAKGSSLGAMVPFFGKAKVKSVLNGSQAQLRVTDTTPEFEITLASNINPTDQFALVKANQKSDRREIEVASVSMVGGSSSGFRKEIIVPTTFEEIKTQTIGGGLKYILYRIKVVNPLPPGEYVFVPQAYAYYDFGVDTNAQNISSTSQQNSQMRASNTTNTNSTTSNKILTNSVSSDNETPEITINADIDKVRAVIVRRFTREKFNLDKDQTSQLVFSKEVGGAGGFMAGVLVGRDQNNPRQIVTFVMTKLGNSVLLLGSAGMVYPDNQGQGNARNVDSKKVRQNLAKELLEIKNESEK